MTDRRVSPAATLLCTAILLASIIALLVSIRVDADPRIIMACALLVLLLLPISACLVISFAISRKVPGRTVRLAFSAAMAATLIVVTYVVLATMLDSAIDRRLPNDSFAGCEKIWSTRGLVRGQDADKVSAGNNPETIRRAFRHGARGVEIDMFYDTDMQAYVVSHDRPYELKNGNILTLAALLKDDSLINEWPERYVWVDLKKLRHLSQTEARQAAGLLARNMKNVGMPKERVYVEGADPVNLGAFRDAGFATIFDTYPLPEENILSGFVANIFKAIYYFGEFTVMSFNYDKDGHLIYGPQLRETLGSIPLFIYHVPDDPALLQDLATLPQVRVILDHDHQADRFSITSCGSGD